MEAFNDWIPYLKHPLVLGGLVVVVVAGLAKALMKNNASEGLQKHAMNGVFVISVLVIILGFYVVNKETPNPPPVVDKKTDGQQPKKKEPGKVVIQTTDGKQSPVVNMGDNGNTTINYSGMTEEQENNFQKLQDGFNQK